MTRLCECGCGTPAPLAKITDSERGSVRGEPLRFVHGHTGRIQSLRIRERLLAKVVVDLDGPWLMDESPCWRWTGRLTGGYGQIGFNGRTAYAHRVAYELWFGPVPGSPPGGKRDGDNLDIDHLCRNRACINPAHLEVVTHKVNVMRGRAATAVNAAKTHCTPGNHEFTPENTYVSPDGKHRECRACRDGQKANQAAWWDANRDRRNAERRAMRVLVKLGTAEISCAHGRSGYTSGCRCQICSDANTAYERTRRSASMYGASGVGQR